MINPKELAEMDTDISDVVGIGEVKESIRGARDVIKIAKMYNGVEYAILAVENQKGVHYAMPIRVMGYDYYSYNKQYKDRQTYYKENKIKLIGDEFISGIKKADRILPVVTLVLYYGEEEWDGPVCLHDMMNISDEIKAYVGNYPLNIISVKNTDLQFHNQMNTDLFKLMSIIYDLSKSRKQRMEEIRRYEAERQIDEKVIDVIAASTNVKIDYHKDGERKMCTLWDELREEGREEGVLTTLISQCCQKYKKNLIVAFISLPLLIIFGSYRFIFNSNISYDINNVLTIEDKIDIELPDEIKVATNKLDLYNISYVKIIDNECKDAFEKEIESTSLWKNELNYGIKNLLPLDIQYESETFDYFVFYNITSSEYNMVPLSGQYECIFIAYDCDLQRLIILNDYKINIK